MSVIGSALPFFFGSSKSGLPAIGASFQGGFFAGTISQTANGVATHALIVAPSASGYNGQVLMKWKTSNTSTPGATSTFDGAANSANMNDANHPAAQYCEGLSIGGYSDWYLPALYELEIAYYNLKPDTTSNNTSSGINAYSVPARGSNYTAGTPAQTSVASFQTGGAESFVALTYCHWSSTQYDSTYGWGQVFDSGYTNGFAKNIFQGYVRAFRKLAL